MFASSRATALAQRQLWARLAPLRTSNTQNPNFWGYEAVTLGENALLGGAGLIKTGLGLAGVFGDALPGSFLGNAGVNLAVTWPALAGIGLEGPIDQAIFCGS